MVVPIGHVSSIWSIVLPTMLGGEGHDHTIDENNDAGNKVDGQFDVQGSANRQTPGWANFVTALAYHFCLALTAAFTQPGDHLLAKRCTSI